MLIALLFIAALALAFANGGSLRSRRVAETMAHKITTVGNAQGLLANSIASSLVIGASLLGSPVSTFGRGRLLSRRLLGQKTKRAATIRSSRPAYYSELVTPNQPKPISRT